MPARMPHFSFSVPLENPLNARSTMKALMPEGSRCFFFSRSRPGEDEEVVGDVGQRDPHLLAGQEVAVAFLDRDRLDAAHVAARGRLGQAVGGDLLPLRLRHEIPLLLILGAPRQQREAVQAGVHRDDDAQRRVDVFELLADDPEADVVHARAAVLGRNGTAQQAHLGHLRQNARVEAVLAIELADPRRHLASGPLPDRLLQQALLFGQIEINHECVLRPSTWLGGDPECVDGSARKRNDPFYFRTRRTSTFAPRARSRRPAALAALIANSR